MHHFICICICIYIYIDWHIHVKFTVDSGCHGHSQGKMSEVSIEFCYTFIRALAFIAVMHLGIVRGSNPDHGRNLKRGFCFMRTPAPPLGPQPRVPEPVLSLKTHLKEWVSERSTYGCGHISRKEEIRIKFNGRWRRVNGKTPRYGSEGERKERWTPTRTKAQDTRPSPNSLETHL